MTREFRTAADYELHLYSLVTEYPAIHRSTVVLVRRGSTLARVEGELHFSHNFWLSIRERLLIGRQPIIIDSYSYNVWQGNTKLYWYDSQPHPNEPLLQSTHPHHKHVPPNIRHNRIPASNLSFSQSNLPMLLQELEQLVVQLQ